MLANIISSPPLKKKKKEQMQMIVLIMKINYAWGKNVIRTIRWDNRMLHN